MRTQAEWLAREQELVVANDLMLDELDALKVTMQTYNEAQAVTDAEAAAAATEANRITLRDAMNVEKDALQLTIDGLEAQVAALEA